jgi:hypothetical protein
MRVIFNLSMYTVKFASGMQLGYKYRVYSPFPSKCYWNLKACNLNKQHCLSQPY